MVPAIGWLMGAVMPLDACTRQSLDEELNAMMEQLQF